MTNALKNIAMGTFWVAVFYLSQLACAEPFSSDVDSVTRHVVLARYPNVSHFGIPQELVNGGHNKDDPPPAGIYRVTGSARNVSEWYP